MLAEMLNSAVALVPVASFSLIFFVVAKGQVEISLKIMFGRKCSSLRSLYRCAGSCRHRRSRFKDGASHIQVR